VLDWQKQKQLKIRQVIQGTYIPNKRESPREGLREKWSPLATSALSLSLVINECKESSSSSSSKNNNSKRRATTWKQLVSISFSRYLLYVD